MPDKRNPILDEMRETERRKKEALIQQLTTARRALQSALLDGMQLYSSDHPVLVAVRHSFDLAGNAQDFTRRM